MIVLSVPELRQLMGNTCTTGYGFEAPNDLATTNMNRILDRMEVQHLEAHHLTVSADGGWGIIWRGREVNDKRGRYCHIECANDGGVCGMRTDYSLPYDNPYSFKFWWISDLTLNDGEPGFTCAEPGELELTLEESLEHIRCYIWADYGDK
jgi:hypothetical protein